MGRIRLSPRTALACWAWASACATDSSQGTRLDGGHGDDSGAPFDSAVEADDASTKDAAPGSDGSANLGDASLDDAQEPPCLPFVMPTNCSAPSDGILPQDLRCTGLYGEFSTRTLACGVHGYTPAHQLWSDGAEKARYVWLPAGTTVDVSDPDNFRFPVGTRFWKEFREPGAGLLETRLLHKSDQGWLYTTYVWEADGSGALQVNQGVEDLHGSGHRVPSRAQCAECHAGREDFVLGWDHLLLGAGAQGMTNQWLRDHGWLSSTTTADGLPSAAQLNSSIPGNAVERAALGYLHVNCGVSCHNASNEARARGTGLWLSLQTDELAQVADTDAVTTGVNKLPSPHAAQPAGGPFLVIRPGDPAHSLLVARMDTRTPGTSMPPIASGRVDEPGVATVSTWIAAMSGPGYPAPDPLPDVGTFDGGAEDASADASPGSEDGGNHHDAGVDAGTSSCDPSSAPVVPTLAVQTVVRNDRLATLTFASQAPGSDDWYLVEMRGRIMRVHGGVLEATPFLDLSSAINLGEGYDETTFTYDERGLVGLAFAPDYTASGLFYVAITPSRGNTLGLPVNNDMVLEYQRASTVGAAPLLKRTLLQVPSATGFLGNIHNANTVLFGPDGKLYVGMGDGGGVNCNDAEMNKSQDVGSVFGKILRLDPSQPAPYAATGNPFASVVGGDARVLHYGLRNPFRFSFDRETGDLYLGDVGQNRFEEIDFARADQKGLNFGWATYEALATCMTPPRALRPGSTHTTPVFSLTRGSTGVLSDYRAIVGGRVYRGSALPELEGTYLFGDYYGKRLGLLTQCPHAFGAQTSPLAILRKSCDPNFPEPCLARPAGSPVFSELTAIVEDHAGELYLVANGNSLLKIVRGP